MIHGSNLENAVTFLLEGQVTSEEHARELLIDQSELPEIDIVPELARLQQCKVHAPLYGANASPLSTSQHFFVRTQITSTALRHQMEWVQACKVI